MKWTYLILLIVAEVIGTFWMKVDKARYGLEFFFAVCCYAGCWWLLAQALSKLPMTVVYSIWSAVGIVATSVIGTLYFKEAFTWMHAAGVSLIVVGIVVLRLAVR